MSEILMDNQPFLYELKNTMITNKEMPYYNCIKSVIPNGYNVIPQANLASFIVKKDGSRYQNELFRNVDFLITDSDFKPYVIIEINDNSHNDYNRKKRDEKVSKICREAGIDIITLWTTYGVNQDYIKKRICSAFEQYPPMREHCFSDNSADSESDYQQPTENKQIQSKDDKKSVSPIGTLALVLSLISCLGFISAAILKNQSMLTSPPPKSEMLIMSVLGLILGVISFIKSKKYLKGLLAFIFSIIGIILFFIV